MSSIGAAFHGWCAALRLCPPLYTAHAARVGFPLHVTARRACSLLVTRRTMSAGEQLDGGAYPLSTSDLIALAALVYLATTAARAARNYFDRTPTHPKKAR